MLVTVVGLLLVVVVEDSSTSISGYWDNWETNATLFFFSPQIDSGGLRQREREKHVRSAERLDSYWRAPFPKWTELLRPVGSASPPMRRREKKGKKEASRWKLRAKPNSVSVPVVVDTVASSSNAVRNTLQTAQQIQAATRQQKKCVYSRGEYHPGREWWWQPHTFFFFFSVWLFFSSTGPTADQSARDGYSPLGG